MDYRAVKGLDHGFGPDQMLVMARWLKVRRVKALGVKQGNGWLAGYCSRGWGWGRGTVEGVCRRGAAASECGVRRPPPTARAGMRPGRPIRVRSSRGRLLQAAACARASAG